MAAKLVRLAPSDARAGPGLRGHRADQRGIGLTDKPQGRYDPGTIANDLVALMGALGHERFAVVGTDTGLPISYALAADHPDRVERVALGEVPGPQVNPLSRDFADPCVTNIEGSLIM